MQNCSLRLTAYDDDGETQLWQVSTDPGHSRPYLCEPEHYGEQEIDVVNGSATISQIEVVVIDRAQIQGEQDSGWITERIVDNGIGAIFGRRFKMERFIDDDTGYVIIADGPGGTPRLDESYAAYRWVIRDTRETERKLAAFTRSSRFGLFPFGLFEDQGWGDKGDGTFAFPAISAPARANVAYGALGNRVTFNMLDPSDQVLTQSVKDIALFTVTNPEFTVPPGSNEGEVGQFADLIIQWRLLGEGEDDWRTIVSPIYVSNIAGILPSLPVFFRTGVGDVTATVGDIIDRIVFSFRDTEEQPAESATVEFIVYYQGPISEDFPLHVEGITLGQFIKNIYDGVYSDRDSITGGIIPSGIRYDETELLTMTTPVRLRLTESVDDARDWIESRGYGPAGWSPALDNSLVISPVSQIPPTAFVGVPTINDTIAEPTSDWNAGERVVNVLSLEYPRWYAPDDPTLSESADGLVKRDIVIEYRDESSIARYGEKKIKYNGELFAAVGTNIGEQVVVSEDEIGRQLAADRNLYIFDRYKNGAQIISILVRRHFSSTLRPGSFVIVDLSWIPDYILRRRGGAFGGQVLAIREMDCAWRMMVIEEILPLTLS